MSGNRAATARPARAALALAACALVAAAAAPAAQARPVLVRASVTASGGQDNGRDNLSALSADGRYVGFSSDASDLVAGDTNRLIDVFVHDLQTGANERVDVPNGGGQAVSSGGQTWVRPALSADGRYVAFQGEWTNLVPGDTNNEPDVFVRDRTAHTTVRVSVATSGAQANGNSEFEPPAISADGQTVAFSSDASNLVAGDTNGTRDIFVHSLATGRTQRVSVATGGGQANNDSWAPAISADGREVVFASDATNLVAGAPAGAIYVRNLASGTTTLVRTSTGLVPQPEYPDVTLSADGSTVAFSTFQALVPADTNERDDVYVLNLATGAVQRASVRSGGAQQAASSGDVALSATGRYVAYDSGKQQGIAHAAFVHDMQTGKTTLLSRTSSGVRETGYNPAISADGKTVSFETADQLLASDTDDLWDVYVRMPAP